MIMLMITMIIIIIDVHAVCNKVFFFLLTSYRFSCLLSASSSSTLIFFLSRKWLCNADFIISINIIIIIMRMWDSSLHAKITMMLSIY